MCSTGQWTAGTIRLPALEAPVVDAYLLSDPARMALPVSQRADGLTISGPASAPDPLASVIVIATE